MGLAIPIIFAALVIYGALSDLLTFRIPNAVPYGLVLLFAAQAVLAGQAPSFMNIAFAAIVLVIGVAFWWLRLMGGGDVKYLASISLFMGPEAGLDFVVLLTVIGLCFGGLLKLSTVLFPPGGPTRAPAFVTRLREKIVLNQLPYGFPIGLAAVAMSPAIFGIR